VKSARRSPSSANGDPEILDRIATGDLEALGTLFDRYEHDVRRFLVRLGIRGADVDDLAQLTFLQVVRAANGYDGRCSAKPWLFGVAVTMARRHRRSFTKMAARLSNWAVMQTESVSAPETPAETLEGREAQARFESALGRLSQKKREVFVMVTLEGASGEDAALALGVPINTIWTRLHHARAELRRELAEDAP
jgi:RNA polymerase sigma-70 factor (ECF subfamily)